MYTLVIGNRNYSSWSLRAWLYLKESQVTDLQVIRVPLYTDNYKSKLLQYSPCGRVPILLDKTLPSPEGSTPVWDSLAIMENLRESLSPGNAVDWPEDKAARAHARSISYEMHSGFLNIRDELPQNLRARYPLPMQELSAGCIQEINRIDKIWSTCKNRYVGKWLFGGDKMTIADIMYVPVALRFVTYSIKVSPESQAFIDAVLANKHVQEWIAESQKEPESLDFIDKLVPAAESPLIL